MKRIIHWPIFISCLVIAALISYGASKWFGLGFWLSFGITVIAWLIIGLFAFAEDEIAGGFNNPKPDSHKRK